MTTNVYDNSTGTLASDSRWSVIVGDYLFYADNVGYEKIVYDTRLAIMFAGHLEIIDAWKRWFVAGREGNAPDVNSNLSLCIIDIATGEIRLDHGKCLRSHCTVARFAGTGAPHAAICWGANKNARKAVETAVVLDMKSGGQVSYLDRQTQENNLKNYSTYQQVMQALSSKGEMIMLKSTPSQKSIPISEAIKDPAVNNAFMKVTTGSASLGAPYMGMGSPWTDEEKSQLYSILAEYPPEPKKA